MQKEEEEKTEHFVRGLDPIESIFTPNYIRAIETHCPWTNRMGRIKRLLEKTGDLCIRNDTYFGKWVLSSMHASLPGTTTVGRAMRAIKTILELQARVDNGEKL